MVATILSSAGVDPTVVIGGKLDSIKSNAKLGQGDYLVAEADESDGSFLYLTPTISVVTNIDPDHLDYYGDMDEMLGAYLDFINKLPFYGLAVLYIDNKNVQLLLPKIKKRFITYGMSAQADLQATDIEFKGMKASFSLRFKGETVGRLSIGMPGIHNINNALAAIAIAMEMDIPFDVIRGALSGFGGIERRFQVKGEADGIMVVDDYGHHPEEIKATLSAAKGGWDKRVVVVFQPHRYTRTRDLFNDFVTAFNDADTLILTDIYAAGEKEIEGITGERLFEEIERHGHRDVSFVPDRNNLPAFLREKARAGDMVITMGAGNIWEAGSLFLDELDESQRIAGVEASGVKGKK
jgi:UDP-N-acetylmuramate--alanine ligase